HRPWSISVLPDRRSYSTSRKPDASADECRDGSSRGRVGPLLPERPGTSFGQPLQPSELSDQWRCVFTSYWKPLRVSILPCPRRHNSSNGRNGTWAGAVAEWGSVLPKYCPGGSAANSKLQNS